MTDDLVSRLRAAEAVMTPGPWGLRDESTRVLVTMPNVDCDYDEGDFEEFAVDMGRSNDTAGIVLLRNLGPGRIADLIEAARSLVDECGCSLTVTGSEDKIMDGEYRFRGCVHEAELHAALTAIEEAGK